MTRRKEQYRIIGLKLTLPYPRSVVIDF